MIAWLAEHWDPERPLLEWREMICDGGWAKPSWSEQWFGRGLPAWADTVVRQAFRDHGAVYTPPGGGVTLASPTIYNDGSDELKDRFLRPSLTGEIHWTQLFSEPGNGSDLAGLTTTATRDGDEWIVNGQKVWTSLAHHSRYGMLLTRTNPDVPKQKGLSYFILDMEAEGVEIRPLYQITGQAEFNEIFLTDVRIADSQRLGDEGDGWRVAITTLMNERVALGGGDGGRGQGPIGDLMRAWKLRKDDLDPSTRAALQDRVVSLWTEAEILRWTNQRAKAEAKTSTAGPAGSVGKLWSAEMNQRIYNLAIELEGANGMLHEAGYPMTRDDENNSYRQELSGAFLRSQANTIEGGTSDIMRNILGERVLGLPGDVRVDKELPWSEIPR